MISARQKVVHADKQEIARVETRAAESIEGISNAWLKAKEVSDAQLVHAAESFGGVDTWTEEAEAEGTEYALGLIEGPLTRASAEFQTG